MTTEVTRIKLSDKEFVVASLRQFEIGGMVSIATRIEKLVVVPKLPWWSRLRLRKGSYLGLRIKITAI